MTDYNEIQEDIDSQVDNLQDCDEEQDIQADENHALTVFGGVVAVISSIVGGGIVGLPYVFYQMGIWTAMAFMAAMGCLTTNSTWLYLKCKDLIPGKPESMFEIGYVLFKRNAIFGISFILALYSFGLCMVYFIIFGQTMGSLAGAAFYGTEQNVDDLTGSGYFFTHRVPYIVGLAVLQLPIMVKKELQELHIVGVGLFTSIMIFVAILFIQLMIFGSHEFSYTRDGDSGAWKKDPLTLADMSKPGEGSNIFTILLSISTSLVAFAFANTLFPTFSALRVKTNENMLKVTYYSVCLVFTIYVFLSVTCLFLFGRSCNQGTDIMKSVNQEITHDPRRKEAFVLQGLFMVVLSCHIPFIFFSGKESICIIIDEIDRNSVSATLDERIKVMVQKEKNQVEEEENKVKLVDQSQDRTMSTNSNVRKASVQSQVRAILQHKSGGSVPNSVKGSVASDVSGGRAQSVISIVRETQSLRKKKDLGTQQDEQKALVRQNDDLSEDSDDGKLAYLDMNNLYYYGATMVYFGIIVFGACVIPNVDVIFEFAGAICVNNLSFIFPGLFYITANNKFKMNRERGDLIKSHNNPDTPPPSNMVLVVTAYMQVILGVTALVLGMFSNIYGLTH